MPRGLNPYDDAKLQGELWTPRTPAGQVIKLWFDALDMSTLTIDGSGNVSQWKDKSGNDNNSSQATAGSRPALRQSNGMLGKPSVFFNNKAMQGPFAYTGTTLTAFGVGTMATGSTNNARLFSVGQSGSLDWNNNSYFELNRTGNTNFAQVYRGGTGTASLAVTLDLPSIFVAIFDGSNYRIGVNGVYGANSANANAFNTVHCQLGLALGSGETWAGFINEVIFDTAPFTLRRLRLFEGYLAWKWGLQNNLAYDRPFKNRPPLTGD